MKSCKNEKKRGKEKIHNFGRKKNPCLWEKEDSRKFLILISKVLKIVKQT